MEGSKSDRACSGEQDMELSRGGFWRKVGSMSSSGSDSVWQCFVAPRATSADSVIGFRTLVVKSMIQLTVECVKRTGRLMIMDDTKN